MRPTSRADWNSYPILRVSEHPTVTPIVVKQLNEPSSGAGEEALSAVPARFGILRGFEMTEVTLPNIKALRSQALIAGALDPMSLRFRIVEYDRSRRFSLLSTARRIRSIAGLQIGLQNTLRVLELSHLCRFPSGVCCQPMLTDRTLYNGATRDSDACSSSMIKDQYDQVEVG